MTVQHFDYEFWKDESRVDWQRLGIHWHCHAWRGDSKDYGDEAARRDPTTELPPKVLKEWLQKPPRSIRQTAKVPEKAISWLRGEWDAIKGQVLNQDAGPMTEETRFGMALYDLRCGNDVCWGFWLGASAGSYLHLAVVGTSTTCH